MCNNCCKFTMKAVRDLRNEPVFLKPVEGTVPDGLAAVKTCLGFTFPAQKKDDGAIVIVTAKEGDEFSLVPNYDCKFGGVSIERDDEKKSLSVKIAGKQFSDYVYSEKFKKPYFGAILDSEGHPFTRLDFLTREHNHHRSLFIGVGDVNGIDFWNEQDPETCGDVRVQSVDEIVTGPAFGSFRASSVWQTTAGKALVNESTTYTVYNQDRRAKYLDLKIVFSADYGDVVFGDTKEAGPLGIRVRDDMRVDQGKGIMRNSYGAVSEAECWGKAAQWCDYCANIEVEPGVFKDMGITVFDNENNERYPTTWHIRDYGLFAANNLFFKGGLTIKEGEKLEYNFRVIFREGAYDRDENVNRFLAYVLQK